MKHKKLRIGILRLHAIGDCVLASPVVEALRDRYPDAHITWIVKSKSSAVVNGLPGLSSTIVWDVGRSRKRTRWLALWKVRLARFDVILDLHTRPQSQFVAPFLRASHASRRIGGTQSAELSRRFCTEIVHEPEIRHLRIACLERAKSLDIAGDAVERYYPRVPVQDVQRHSVGRFLEESKINGQQQIIVLNLGGGETVAERKWPTSNFAELTIRILMSFPQARVVILGGPADTTLVPEYRDQLLHANLPQRVADGESRIRYAVGKLKLMEVAALAEQCHAFVTTDTGPMHIAAAVGAPIIALFGPTNSVTNAPVHKPGSAPIKLLDAREITGQWPASLETLAVDTVFRELSILIQSKILLH